MNYTPPSHDCPICPRLVSFREENRAKFPSFFNAPVPSFGALDAEFLVVGLAPGLKGANQTGRPFTGDYAGLVLYSGLKKYGFAAGEYDPQKVARCQLPVADKHRQQETGDRQADGFHLLNCRITNGVRCVPQENKPEPSEIKQCNKFLKAEISAMPNLKAILCLGLISHKAVLMALGLKQSTYTFVHGAHHSISVMRGGALRDDLAGESTRSVDGGSVPPKINLFNSYHCSRYNINTGRLTQAMFDEVVGQVRDFLKK